MNIRQTIFCALAPLSVMAIAETATAHMLQTDYTMRLDSLEIQATLGEGESFPDAPVSIYSPNNPDEPIFTGRTDSEGKFSFQPDQEIKGEWAVEIGDAETSHWDYLVVPVTGAGVELDAISQAAPAADQDPHRHDTFAYSFVLIVASLWAIAGFRFLRLASRR